MDRRQRKTQNAIFDAFTQLLKEKSYSKITVQEIIDLADVGRTTFYSHFEAKDDLVRSFYAQLFSHVFSEDLAKEKTHDFSAMHDLKAQVTHILYHLEEHLPYLSGLLFGSEEQVIDLFRRQMLDHFSPLLPADPGTSIPRDYVLNHIVCDFTETVRWWSAHRQYSPEEIGNFFFETSPLGSFGG